MKILWRILLILLFVVLCVNADNKDQNDPNELLLAKWDAVIKDPNDPNELLCAKWDAIVKVLQSKELDPKVKTKIIDQIVSPPAA